MADTTLESNSNKKSEISRTKKKEHDAGGTGLNQHQQLSPELLKYQIEEAKGAKDFKLAQKLREQLWTLHDTIALGPAGSGASCQPLTSENEVNLSESLAKEEPKEVSDSFENPTLKSLHKLEKKMKAIQELKLKRSKGVKLEANQRAKIGTEDEVRKEIELLKKMLGDS